ncbi:RHS repeat-associated core domain-containing protein [Streptomyces sp. NPDC007355]|uniref:RHS repeat-associated core domain-containing protein n=1 Tax=Streptomyces sp. NPDC007355 TaxID=3364778 RepID=UPI003687E666
MAGAKAGLLPGSGSVAADGAFSYRIPLDVPAGRAGMAPSLSLGYASGGGNGVLGLGWSLAGMGDQLGRCGAAPDTEGSRTGIHYDDKDKYCLNGQKLILITGTYGGDGSEYRTESGPFEKIKAVGGTQAAGPDKFLLFAKDGRTFTYEARVGQRAKDGVSLQSLTRIDPSESGNFDPDGSVETKFDPSGRHEVTGTPRVTWLLSEVSDRSGNRMAYEYTEEVTKGQEFLLSKIRYTYGDGKEAERRVEFQYEDRPDPSFSYVSGVRYAMSKRLKQVDMYAPNPGATTLVHSYKLSYLPVDGSHRHSALSQVQKCGAKGGCLPAKKFTWSNSLDAPLFTTTTRGGSLPLDASGSMNGWAATNVQDLDDDGADDLVFSTGGSHPKQSAVLGGSRKADGTVDPLASEKALQDAAGAGVGAWPSGAEGRVRESRPVDIDGDGVTEYVVRYSVNGDPGLHDKVLRWDKAAGKFVATDIQFGQAFFEDWADVNGDGLLDRIASTPDPLPGDDNTNHTAINGFVKVQINKGGGQFEAPTESLDQACAPGVARDMDGDGQSEYQYSSADSTFCNDSWQYGASSVGSASDSAPYEQIQHLSSTRDLVKRFAVNPFLNPQPSKGRDHTPIDTPVPGDWAYIHDFDNPLFSWKSFQGDFNGDGLKDTLMVPTARKADGTYEQSMVLWNTGHGLHFDLKRISVTHDDLADLQIGDMNGDGRDDIVSFYNTKLSVDRKDKDKPDDDVVNVDAGGEDRINILFTNGGNGDATQPWSNYQMNVSAGIRQPDVMNGRPFSRLGDFNGDGRLDIVKNDGGLAVMTQNASQPDRITAVSDENAPRPRMEVEYSNTWAEKPAKIADNECAAPLVCVRSGMTVVRKLTSHEDGYDTDKPRSVYYSYQDPVMHRRQGFLGFGTFRMWDPSRPVETVTTFDKRTSANDGRVYPFAHLPKTVTVTTPVLTDEQVAAKPGTAKARVEKTVNSFDVTVEPRINSTFTYRVQPQKTVSTSADANVAVDWTADHVANANMEQHLVGNASAPFRTATSTMDYDEYGNQTKATSVTSGTGKGLSTIERVNAFELGATRLSNWLISVPDSTTVTAREALGQVELSASTDTLTLAGHGLANGEEVVLAAFDKNTGLSEDTVYVVRDATANTFKLAAIQGGTALDVTADATAEVSKKAAAPVTRHTDYTADTLGRVYRVDVEKDNTDADVRSSSVATIGANGVVTKLVSSAPGRPDRIVHAEHDPVFTGQPDEDIYPSQTWAERADVNALYRPSTWSAVQPAYGITVAAEDTNGVRSSVAFDDLGRTTTATADGAPTVSTVHSLVNDSDGQMIGTAVTTTTATGTAGKNAVTTAYTDQAGRARFSAVTGFDGKTITTAQTYDRLGRAATTTRPTTTATAAGESHTYYDTLDRVIKTVTADGKEAATSYPDAFTVTATDTAGRTSDAVTDNAGHVVKTVHHYTKPDKTPATSVSTAEYGPFDALLKATDDKNNTVTTGYDILGRPITVTDPDRGKVTTAYYGDGLIDTLTHNGSNNTITNTYDDLGRLTGARHHDADANKDTTTSFVFDTATNGKGQLATATNVEDKVTTAYRYDSLGRPLGRDLTVDGTAYSSDTTYDTLGRPKTATYPQTGAGRMQLTSSYNDYGYLSDINDTTNTTSTPLWHADAMNADLALTSAKIGPSGAIVQTNAYNPTTGRLENQTTTGTGGKLQNISYGYHDDGNLHTRTQNDLTTGKADRVESYTYDDFNRLASWTLTNNANTPRTSSYNYDTLGNLTKVTNTGDNLPAVETRTYGNQDPKAGPHALAAATATTLGGAESYEYDKQGRLTLAKDTTGKAFRTTVYNAFDLPTTVTDKNGKTTSYLYDAFGTRVKKTDPDNSTTVYADGFEKRTTPDNKVTYIQYLPHGIGQAVTTGNTTTTEYTLTDKQGSTGATTDKTGSAVTNPVYYDPWGQPINASGVPQTSTPGDITHGYTGHEMENSLRLVNMNGRTYDPAAKTFNTPDPVTTNHPYTYVNANPTLYTDPTGYDGQTDTPGGIPGGDITGVQNAIGLMYGQPTDNAANVPTHSGCGPVIDGPGCIQSSGFQASYSDMTGLDMSPGIYTGPTNLLTGDPGGPTPPDARPGNAIANDALWDGASGAAADSYTNPSDYYWNDKWAAAIGDQAIWLIPSAAPVLAERIAIAEAASAMDTLLAEISASNQAIAAEAAAMAKELEVPAGIFHDASLPHSGLINRNNGSFNCMACSISADASMAGHPARALGDDIAGAGAFLKSGEPMPGPFEAAENYVNSLGLPYEWKYAGASANDVEAAMINRGGGRGIVMAGRQPMRPATPNGSHVWNIEGDNGIVSMWDYQADSVVSGLEKYKHFWILYTTP